MKALIILPETQKIDITNLKDDDHLRKLVGGYFGLCFRVHVPNGESIVGYCDEDAGLKSRMDYNIAIGSTIRMDAPYPIIGPVVIVGITRGGKHREVTPIETGKFTLSPEQRWHGLPLLQWEG